MPHDVPDRASRISVSPESPEGDLWIDVLRSAFADLLEVTDWMPRHVHLRRLWPPPPLSGATRAQLREKVASARSVLAFFADDPTSTLDFICATFDLDQRDLRAVARQKIDHSRLRERTDRAELWLGGAAIAV